MGATIEDHGPGMNIFPSGTCHEQSKPCLPLTPSPWEARSTVFFGDLSVLREDPTLACDVGGHVHITDPGQHKVNIGDLENRFETNLDLALEHAASNEEMKRLLGELLLSGVSEIPKSALGAPMNDVQRLMISTRLSPSAMEDLSKALGILKGLRLATGEAVAAAFDEAAVVPAASGGLAGEGAAALGCTLAGVGAGIGADKVVGCRVDRL